MTIQKITEHVYAVPLGFVNTFLIDQDELTLIDAGIAGSEKAILSAIQDLGRQAGDLKQILVTHLHGDHIGSLAALQHVSGAKIWMHPADAELARQGLSGRPSQPGPGVLNRIIYTLFVGRQVSTGRVEPARIDGEFGDGQIIPAGGGIRAIHTPGHTAGHTAFLWEGSGGVLFAGDMIGHITRLGYGMLYEDLAEGQRSIRMIAGLQFNILCFGHGATITSNAADVLRASRLVKGL
jgi:glyoxylase-like metal-dependent hydrolase (beta-lactamase superfamily II)